MTEETQEKQKKKVLIVEDQEQFSRALSISLEREGFAALTASDGEEGISVLLAEKPDLVLLDLMLPKKDGFWFLAEQKKYEQVAHVPVIVLSNLGQKEDKARARELGAKEYLVKADISMQMVADMAKKHLS